MSKISRNSVLFFYISIQFKHRLTEFPSKCRPSHTPSTDTLTPTNLQLLKTSLVFLYRYSPEVCYRVNFNVF